MIEDFHSLRHSTATRLASQNVPLPVAMPITSHRDQTDCQAVYKLSYPTHYPVDGDASKSGSQQTVVPAFVTRFRWRGSFQVAAYRFESLETVNTNLCK